MWTHAIDYDTDNDVYYENNDYLTSHEALNDVPEMKLNAFSYNNKLVVDVEGTNYDRYKISVFSINGQVLHHKFLMENESSIILRDIPTGIYIIRAESSRSSKTLKTIVN